MENKESTALPYILYGEPVAARLWETLQDKIAALAARDIVPTLAVVRVGEKADDLAYYASLQSAFALQKLRVLLLEFAADAEEETLCAALETLSKDPKIHGALPLLPFPPQMDAARVLSHIAPQKDVDGVTAASKAFVYDGTGQGFTPCTAAAVMELFRFYQIPLQGQDVTILGRSSVIGKPLAMLLLRENATPTICHSKSDLWMLAHSPIAVFATGRVGVAADMECKKPPILIDCGINVLPNGHVVGDLSPKLREQARAYTPVPNGVGAVTVSILAKHLAEACEAQHDT